MMYTAKIELGREAVADAFHILRDMGYIMPFVSQDILDDVLGNVKCGSFTYEQNLKERGLEFRIEYISHNRLVMSAKKPSGSEVSRGYRALEELYNLMKAKYGEVITPFGVIPGKQVTWQFEGGEPNSTKNPKVNIIVLN